MLVTTELERVFLFEDNGHERRLSDPDSSMTKEMVLNFYSPTFPILTTATIQGPEIKDDQLQYRFVSTMGTKG